MIRIPADLAEKLRLEAKANRRSLTAQAVLILEGAQKQKTKK